MTRSRDLSEIVNSTGLSVDTDTLVVDSANNRVGIGTDSPGYSLQVQETSPIIAVQSTGVNTSRLLLSAENDAVYIGTTYGGSNIPMIFSRGGTSSGSASMTIDASGNVGIGTSSPSTYDSRANNLVVGDSGDAGVTIFSGATSNARLVFAASGDTGLSNGGINYDNNNDSLAFEVAGSEAMRIDSAGHIHTGYTSNFGGDHVNVLASDGGGISIAQNNAGTATSGTILGSLSFQSYLNGQTLAEADARISAIAAENQSGSAAGTDLAFYTKPNGTGPGSAPSERMRIDARGVVGINAVPEAWDAAFSSVLQVGAMSVLTSGGDNARIFGNAYYDGGATYKRINTGPAQAYEQTTGQHRWYNAASGAADSTFTWSESMRIDASGNLLVGTTDTTIYNNSANNATDNGMVYSAVDSRLDVTRYTTNLVAAVASFNRTGNDGSILSFAKSGTSVGSIGANSGTPYMSGNLGGFRLTSSSGAGVMVPTDTDGNASDADNDLGVSSARWRDLYLSGSVVHTFDVVNNGTTDYQFSDTGSNWFPTAENDPVLYLRRGETYIFSVVAGGHPFEIRLSNGGAAYTTGVTNNGAQNGDVVFKVPMSAPSTLYYQCTVHSGMGNIINIV